MTDIEEEEEEEEKQEEEEGGGEEEEEEEEEVLGQWPVLVGKHLISCEIKATVVLVVVVMSLQVKDNGECGDGVGKPAVANHSVVASVIYPRHVNVILQYSGL